MNAPGLPPIERVSVGVDLLYSPLDGGFYFQSFEEGVRRVSETYATREEALGVMGDVEWEYPEESDGCGQDEWQEIWRWAWGLDLAVGRGCVVTAAMDTILIEVE
jgi:hypothetical protein